MKKNLIQKSILIMLFFSPLLFFATAVQTPPKSDDFYKQAVEFLQGKGLVEEWFTRSFLPLFNVFMKSEYGSMIVLGQAIAGGGTLCYLSYIGWQMVSGDKQWEIMPILKPFATGLVLMNWLAFTDLIKKPTDMLRDGAIAGFETEQAQVNALRWKHYKLQNIMVDRIYEQQGEALAAQQQQEQANESMLDQMADIVDGLFNIGDSIMAPVYELTARLQIQVSMALSTILQIICIWILRLAIYGVLFIALLFGTFLIITGPIPIGLSVVPAFRSLFVVWVTNFINVSLYGFVAFTILRLGMLMIKFGYTAEIERYSKVINEADGSITNTGMFMQILQSNNFSLGLVVVSMLVTAFGVFLTPKICNLIISGSGVTTAVNSVSRTITTTATTAVK